MKDVQLFKENPFININSVTFKNKRIAITTDSSKKLLDTKTGQEQEVYIGSYREVDDQEFVKIFTANISFMFELTPPGNTVFQMLLTIVQKNALQKDMVYLSEEMCMELSKEFKIKISPATFRRGLKDLLKNQILAKSTKAFLYFINPHVLFNGNRVGFFNAIRKKNEKNGVTDENTEQKQITLS